MGVYVDASNSPILIGCHMYLIAVVFLLNVVEY